MSKLETIIQSIPNLYCAKGCTFNEIKTAEKTLGLSFSTEYVEYLKLYGAISFYGVELTGLNVDNYVNVVAVTSNARNNSSDFPSNCIVVENTGNEGLLILQNKEGEVFEYIALVRFEKIFNSLAEYIESVLSP